MDIPQQVKDLIHSVVEQDEGGWVLTHNSNDPDGGWTFGGITSKNWEEAFSAAGTLKFIQQIPIEQVEALADHGSIGQLIAVDVKNKAELVWIDRGIEIYYTKFYQPAVAIAEKSNPIDVLFDCEFSCAINIGLQEYNKLLDIVDRTPGCNYPNKWKETFCKAWMDHYIQLVEGNAKAWQARELEIEKSLQNILSTGKAIPLFTQKPPTLRAEFLQGWFNRVWRYLP